MHISVSEAREKFAEIVNRVQYGGERVVIEKRGKPSVVLVSLEAAAFFDEMEDRLLAKMADEAKAEMERDGVTIPWESVKADLKLP